MEKYRKLIRAAERLLYPETIYCISCGHPIDPGMPYSLCRYCREHYAFAESGHKATGYHATWYSLWEKETVLRFKYANCAYYAGPMADMMADMLQMYGKADCDGIVAVPIHADRLRTRGYNQAELLARELAERLEKPYVPDALRRLKKTSPLKTLGETERRNELMNAFGPGSGDVAGKRILLVDDILTTGATASVCTDVLRAMGAVSVRTVTFAATARGKEPVVRE